MSGLSLIEQETIITYNRKEDFVEIATRVPRDLTKLKKLAKDGIATLLDDDRAGYVKYKMPIGAFSWSKKRSVSLSDEQKEALVARMKKARKKKS